MSTGIHPPEGKVKIHPLCISNQDLGLGASYSRWDKVVLGSFLASPITCWSLLACAVLEILSPLSPCRWEGDFSELLQGCWRIKTRGWLCRSSLVVWWLFSSHPDLGLPWGVVLANPSLPWFGPAAPFPPAQAYQGPDFQRIIRIS